MLYSRSATQYSPQTSPQGPWMSLIGHQILHSLPLATSHFLLSFSLLPDLSIWQHPQPFLSARRCVDQLEQHVHRLYQDDHHVCEPTGPACSSPPAFDPARSRPAFGIQLALLWNQSIGRIRSTPRAHAVCSRSSRFTNRATVLQYPSPWRGIGWSWRAWVSSAPGCVPECSSPTRRRKISRSRLRRLGRPPWQPLPESTCPRRHQLRQQTGPAAKQASVSLSVSLYFILL